MSPPNRKTELERKPRPDARTITVTLTATQLYALTDAADEALDADAHDAAAIITDAWDIAT